MAALAQAMLAQASLAQLAQSGQQRKRNMQTCDSGLISTTGGSYADLHAETPETDVNASSRSFVSDPDSDEPETDEDTSGWSVVSDVPDRHDTNRLPACHPVGSKNIYGDLYQYVSPEKTLTTMQRVALYYKQLHPDFESDGDSSSGSDLSVGYYGTRRLFRRSSVGTHCDCHPVGSKNMYGDLYQYVSPEKTLTTMQRVALYYKQLHPDYESDGDP